MINVRAITFQEGGPNGPWVVQGLEYDIVTRADRLEAVPHAFTRAVIENMVITQHLGRRPLEGVKPAPRHFHEMFEAAEMEITQLKRLEISLRPQIETPRVSVRVTSHALAA